MSFILVHSSYSNYFDKLSKLVNFKYSNGTIEITTFQKNFFDCPYPSPSFEENKFED